jgi:2-haloacid dehalogenase
VTRPAIVFDFGGVLVDWNPRYLYRKLFPGDEAGMERFLEEIGFTEWNVHQDRGRSFKEAVEVHSARFPHRADLIRAYRERWEESVSGPISGSVELLEGLKRAGYALHGLSNWSAETFPLARARFPFFGHFETILLSGEVRLAKPDPAIFRVLLERLGRKAQECVFIDDSAANIEAASALGFDAIHFKSAAQVKSALQKKGIQCG